jgi:hypothetical protein
MISHFLHSSELREQIKPEIIELIKEQRLNYLVEGTRFQKYNNGKRVKGEMRWKSVASSVSYMQDGASFGSVLAKIVTKPCVWPSHVARPRFEL